MASRSVSVGWFAVGFLAGVGATLATIIFATRPHPTRIALPAPPPATAGAAVVTYHAPQVAQASAPPLAGPILPHPPPPAPIAPAAAPPPAPAATPRPSRPAGPDEQTREDAAAAGMTSRARTGG